MSVINTKKLKNISKELSLKAISSFKNSSTLKKILLFLVFGVILITVGMTVGRYVYLEVRDFYLASKNFYFESDKLKTSIARYQIDNWSGVDSYTITVNMDSYKNNSEYATSDISYDITYRCSADVTCSISKTSGVIPSITHTDSYTITMTPDVQFDDGDTVWIETTASSTSPYEKELSGRFVIKVGKIGLSYEITDKIGSPYLDLSVTNTLDYYIVKEAFSTYSAGDRIDISTYLALSSLNKDKCASSIITLDFDPNIVLLDMTNEKYLSATDTSYESIGGYDYISGLTFKIDAVSSAVVRFYKKNTTLNYTYPFVNATPVVTMTYE